MPRLTLDHLDANHRFGATRLFGRGCAARALNDTCRSRTTGCDRTQQKNAAAPSLTNTIHEQLP